MKRRREEEKGRRVREGESCAPSFRSQIRLCLLILSVRLMPVLCLNERIS